MLRLTLACARGGGDRTRERQKVNIHTVRHASMGETMGIGTSRYLPLGITTDDRWGAARRRRLLAIWALSALAVAVVVIAESAHDLMTANSADARTAIVNRGTPEVPVKPRSTQPPTEEPSFAATATEPAILPVPAPGSPSAVAIEPPTVSAALPDPPSVPTVLPGAGKKSSRAEPAPGPSPTP